MHAPLVSVLTLAGLIVACSPPSPRTAISIPEVTRIDVLRAERERGAGVARLIEYSGAAYPLDIRLLALRGLGRTGEESGHELVSSELSARARETLLAALEHADAPIRTRAAQSLGVSQYHTAEPALLARLARESDAGAAVAIIHALGRLGGARSLPALSARLARPELAEAAAHALGNFGIRAQPLDTSARRALVRALAFVGEDVHLAVAFALEREHQPPDTEHDDAGVVSALRSLAGHASAEVRATALRALSRRHMGLDLMRAALDDRDWRVRARAARGIASLLAQTTANAATEPDAGRTAGARLAARILAEWQALADARFQGPGVHVITEALSGANTGAGAQRPEIAGLAEALERRAAEVLQRSPDANARLAASTVHCMSAAVLARARSTLEPLTDCGGADTGGMPAAERVALLADLLADGLGRDARRRLHDLRSLAEHSNPRIRARAVAALPAFVSAGDLSAEDLATTLALLAGALRDPETDVTGSAAGAIIELASTADKARADALPSALTAPLLTRAGRPDLDSELAITLLDALAAIRAPEAADLCARARRHENRTIREHARACSQALGQPVDAPASEARAAPEPWPANSPRTLPAPPDDAFLDRPHILVLDTSKGEIRIRLAPDVAPWSVAAITSLAADGFYNGLTWHRVVPDFVVQGGDPTGSGWGGPGFELPAEPWWLPYSRGAVGIADAGLDTGGSQLFIMHSRAHRLDGRYTLIGYVIAGQDAADSLMVGDIIRSARVPSE